MENYRRMYYVLFNAVTDALNALDRGSVEAAYQLLVEAQQRAEEMYMEADDSMEKRAPGE